MLDRRAGIQNTYDRYFSFVFFISHMLSMQSFFCSFRCSGYSHFLEDRIRERVSLLWGFGVSVRLREKGCDLGVIFLEGWCFLFFLSSPESSIIVVLIKDAQQLYSM